MFKMKRYFLILLLFLLPGNILSAEQPTPKKDESGILTMEERYGKDLFIFQIDPKTKNALDWGKPLSPKIHIEKAKQFIKNHIGEDAKYWDVNKFEIIVESPGFDESSYYYRVGFFMMPKCGILAGLAGTFYVYLNPEGEIRFRKTKIAD